MRFAKLCQRLAADQKRYRAMDEKKQKSFYGRFIARRIRKTLTRIHMIQETIGMGANPGDYKP